MMIQQDLGNAEHRLRISGALAIAWLAALIIANMAAAQEPNLAEPVKAATRLTVESTTVEETPITADDREHWSFQPIVRPELPDVRSADWCRSAIDRFIARQLEENQLVGAPEATPDVWLRRLKLDLLGLPPTETEVADFVADLRPDAAERLVDRWLASPRFGERWAQHWLDLARFAETDGFEHDKVRENAWEYRDWVITSLNSDMPYDEFVKLQLMGDQSSDARDRIATMFCLASSDMPDINNQELRRHDRLNELTSTIGSTLLGLQMHCAQCHDHKYDPISQADFYRLRAIFEPAVPELRRDAPCNVFSGDQKVAAARFYARGELHLAGPELKPSIPRIAASGNQPLASFEQNPRSQFANWLFTSDNTLTARIIVNRIWQHHFGRSLIENPSDVGVIAGGPTNAELLDWLASEMQRQRWSMKALHRQIVLSATYRQASLRMESDLLWSSRLEIDRDNRLYSRYPRHRLDGETIRDSMLAVAGLLNTQAGGPSVMPPLPELLTGTLLKGQWTPTPSAEAHVRRSIYVFARRNLRYPLFEVFDRPDAGASCSQRDRSTTAIQSLQMLNSELSVQCAQGLRTRWLSSENAGEIARLFQLALGRSPTETECDFLTDFLKDRSAESELAACLAMLNTSEFIYVD